MKNLIDYKSVPVTASVIKTVNSKSVYLYNIESLDSNTIYKPRFIPQTWTRKSDGKRMVILLRKLKTSLLSFHFQ